MISLLQKGYFLLISLQRSCMQTFSKCRILLDILYFIQLNLIFFTTTLINNLKSKQKSIYITQDILFVKQLAQVHITYCKKKNILIKLQNKMASQQSTSKLNATLQYVLGITAENQHQLQPYKNNNLAVVTGANIMFYNPIRNQQFKYICHKSSQISAISISPDKNYIAVGQFTKGSPITIYALNNQNRLINSPHKILKGHRNGVHLLCFSPNNKYLASLSNEDGGLFIWEDNIRLTQNKMSKKVNKMLFTQQGNLITAGKQHLKLWNFNKGQIIRTLSNQCWIMQGKGFSLGKKFVDKQFIALVNKDNLVLTLTSDGYLCVIFKQAIEKWVNLKIQNPTCLQLMNGIAFCGGDDSIVKIIEVQTLQLLGLMPKPPAINKENIEKDSKIYSEESNEKYPQCISLKIIDNMIISLYSNKTMFIWDSTQVTRLKPIRSFLSHQKEITCIELLEEISNQVIFFATSSRDKTIRIWHIYEQCFDTKESVDIAKMIGIKRNAYCKNLTRIIYTNEEIKILKNHNLKLLACSNHTITFYSLKTFNIIFAEQLGYYIQCAEINKQQLFIGTLDNTIRVYDIYETSLKSVRVIKNNEKVQKIVCGNNLLITLGNKILRIQSLDTYELIREERKVISMNMDQKYLYYATEAGSLNIHFLQKNKLKESFKLENYLANHRIPQIIRNNSSYILTVVTTQNPNVISLWDHYGNFLYQEFTGDNITGVMLCQNGDAVFVGNSGSITFMQYIYSQKNKKVEINLKKWLEMNDLSWTVGSIWMTNVNNKVTNKQEIIPQIIEGNNERKDQNQKVMNFEDFKNIEMTQSVRYEEIPNEYQSNKRISLPNNISNININYKKDDNKQSIFNPSDIYNQARGILNKVQDMEKKINIPQKNSNIFQSNRLEPIQLGQNKQSTKNLLNTKDVIIEEEQANKNLSPVKDITTQYNTVNMRSQVFSPNTLIKQLIKTIEKAQIQNTQQILISQNEPQLSQIYQFLHKHLKRDQREQKLKKTQNLIKQFSKKLKNIINQNNDNYN